MADRLEIPKDIIEAVKNLDLDSLVAEMEIQPRKIYVRKPMPKKCRLGFGARVRRLRRKMHVTQMELGKIMAVSYQHISKWESAHTYPHNVYIRKIEELESQYGIVRQD